MRPHAAKYTDDKNKIVDMTIKFWSNSRVESMRRIMMNTIDRSWVDYYINYIYIKFYSIKLMLQVNLLICYNCQEILK
jgi:hypothetical protein